MAMQISVKNTFIDFPNDDAEDEECMCPVMTCPLPIVKRLSVFSDAEDVTPECRAKSSPAVVKVCSDESGEVPRQAVVKRFSGDSDEARRLTVKNTFIDLSEDDDDEEGCVCPVKTCPAVVTRSSDGSYEDGTEEEDEEHMFQLRTLNGFSPLPDKRARVKTCPAFVNEVSVATNEEEEDEQEDEEPVFQVNTFCDYSPLPVKHARVKPCPAYVYKCRSNEDCDEDEEEESVFQVKTLNDFSPHHQKYPLQMLPPPAVVAAQSGLLGHANLRKDTVVEDPPVEPVVPAMEKRCACGYTFMPEALFCCKCGTKRGQAPPPAPVEQLVPRTRTERSCQQTAGVSDAVCRLPPHHPVMLPVLLPVMRMPAPGVDARTTAGEAPTSARKPMSVARSDLVEVDAASAAAAGTAGPRAADIVSLENRQPEWSRGAMFHCAGQCKPCGWFWKPQGCEYGQECCHCHLCPRGELKARRKSAKAKGKNTE
jgi:hypothetical protein